MPAYKDKNGTWFCKFSINNRQILKRGFKTKRDALKYENQTKAIQQPGASITFQTVADSYYKYREVADSTLISVQDNEQLAPATKNLVLRVVKQIFKYGAEFYELPNYAVGLKSFKITKKEMQTWTPEQFNQFIQHVHIDVYKYYFIVLYWTGMREMECANLRYTDIENNTVHVRGTKTFHSDRTITVPNAISRIFSLLQAQCDDEQPFIFGGLEPLKNPSIHRVFKCAIKNAGVPEIRVHDLKKIWWIN